MKFLFTYISFTFLVTCLLLPDSLCAQVQPPSFLACEDVSVCSFGTKDDLIHVDLQAAVTNHCISNPGLYWTTHIDLYSDGSVDQTLTKPDASDEFPLGIHTITFWAADGCGGVSSCQRVVTVRDCLPPVAVCKDKFVELMPSSGMVVTPAKDLLGWGVSDNMTPVADLQVLMERMSDVSEFQTMPDADALPMIPVTCDDMPPVTNCNQVEFRIWIGDAANNWSSCSSTIGVNDWGGACAAEYSWEWLFFIDVWNNNITENGFIVLDAQQYCSDWEVDTLHLVHKMVALIWYVPGINKVYQVFKQDGPSNGIDVQDLFLLKSLIVHQTEPNLSFQVEAGDVNQDCFLSIADYLLLRKQILTNFAGVDSTAGWRFIPIVVLEETGIPDLCGPQEVYQMYDLLNNGPTYIGYKLGDLNHDHQVEPFTESDTRDVLGTTTIRIADQQHISGEEIALSLHLPSDITYSALQLELNLDEDNLVFVDLHHEGSGELTWDQDQTTGHIRILWVSESPGNVPQFKLILKARKSSQLSTSLEIAREDFRAIVYTLNGEKRNLDLVWSVEEGSELIIRPLLSGQTSSTLSFWVDAPKRGEYTVNLFDLLGRGIYQGQIEIESGGQQINLPISNMPSGVLACRITKGNQSAGCSTLIQE